MAGHTPGPWTLAPTSCFLGEAPVPAGWVGLKADGWSDFALVVTRLADEPFDCPTGVANARLIAAAPEMAEALEPFATAARYINPDLPDSTVVDLRIGPNTVYSVALESLRAALAAIAKAEGK